MKSENGFSLVEVLMSLALLGIISTVFIGSLFTASKSTLTTEERQIASNLAETQMEFVQSQGYATSYTPAPMPAQYTGYTTNIVATSLQDSNIQKITVTISHLNKIPARLEGYKLR